MGDLLLENHKLSLTVMAHETEIQQLKQAMQQLQLQMNQISPPQQQITALQPQQMFTSSNPSFFQFAHQKRSGTETKYKTSYQPFFAQQEQKRPEGGGDDNDGRIDYGV